MLWKVADRAGFESGSATYHSSTLRQIAHPHWAHVENEHTRLNHRGAVRHRWKAAAEPGTWEGPGWCLFLTPCVSTFSGSGMPGWIRPTPSLALRRALLASGRVRHINSQPVTNVNNTRNETMTSYTSWYDTLRWTRHHLWDSPAKSVQREPVMRKRPTNLKWGTFYEITGLDTSKNVNCHKRPKKRKSSRLNIERHN